MKTLTATLTLFVLSAAAPARAQGQWTDRGYINAGAIYRATSSSLTDTQRPIEFGEAATIATTYPSQGAPGFEGGGGVRVWRNLGVGVDVTYTSNSGTASIEAQVPHPLYFNQPRSVSGTAPSIERQETGVHVQLLWMIPMSPRWRLALTGGPSFFSLAQDLVTDVTVTSAYPFDTATFAGAATQRATGTSVGYNAGADVTVFLARHFGLGASVSFSQATITLTSGSDSVKVDAGGVHAGGGIRIRF